MPNCQCPCGDTRFTVHGAPLMRAFCHCTLWQALNRSPYADITLFRRRDVSPPTGESLDLSVWRRPPAAQRGKCRACQRPAIEFMRLPLVGELVIVPSANIGDAALVPAPALHIFYDSRVADIVDELPRYRGYWRSQLAFSRRLLGAMLRHRHAT